jgi:peptide/nickel transport system substrate-binding protein
MERGAFLDDVGDKRQFEASLRMINATIRDADAVLTRRVHSSMLGGGNNYSGYANKEVDALIEKARVETDREKRLETYSEVYDILDEDVPLIPIYTTSSYLFFKHGLKEVYTHPVERYKICDMYFE